MGHMFRVVNSSITMLRSAAHARYACIVRSVPCDPCTVQNVCFLG